MTWGRGASGRELELLRAEVREVRQTMTDWQRQHVKQHASDRRNAVTGRRWMIGTCISVMVMMIALLTLVLQVYGRTRG